jgi:uncharacterized phage protein (predicted DNA packaging)
MYNQSQCIRSGQSKVIDVSFVYADPIVEPVTLEEVKEYMRVDYPDDDDVIERLITMAREWAEKHAAISIIPREVTAWVESVNRIELPYGPVTTPLASIVVKNESGTTLTGIKYIGADYPRIIGYGTYVATYDAGFTEVPEGLKIAICAKVLAQFENRGDEWKDKYDGIAWANLQPYRRVTWV